MKLTVTGSGGSDSEIKNNFISVRTTGINLIQNPEFDQGMLHWSTFLKHDSRYTMSIDNNYVLSGQNSLKYIIEEGGTENWYITVFAYTPLQKDKYYEVRFKAKLEGRTVKGIKIRLETRLDLSNFSTFLNLPFYPSTILQIAGATRPTGLHPSLHRDPLQGLWARRCPCATTNRQIPRQT